MESSSLFLPTLIHYLHALLSLYVLTGGFLPFPLVYVVVMTIVIWGWVEHNCHCVVNNGYSYPENSMTVAFLSEIGVEHGKRILKVALPVNIAISFYKTGIPTHVLALLIYYLHCELGIDASS